MTPEVAELDALLAEAERKLAASQLGPGAGFHSMPIVFVIGPEGSTKTTVVLKSGLEPELLAGQVFQDDTVIPTGLANIWYAGRTVFVEPGQRLRADHGLWTELLHRMRSRNGSPRAAIVCYGCENFHRPDWAEALGEAGRQLRAKL